MRIGELFSGIACVPDTLRDRPFSGAVIDSRKDCKGKLFFALKGKRHDGHRFAEEAFKKGAVGCVVERAVSVPHILVDDVYEALWRVSERWLSWVNPTVVAITGSAGKTTTKEMARCILESTFNCHFNAGNENNLIGVPITLLNMPADCEVLVVELGTNSPGEIEKLASLCKPDISVITTIGPSHLEGLGSVEGVFKEKISLVNHTKQALIFPAFSHFSQEAVAVCKERGISCVLIGEGDYTFEELAPGHYRFFVGGETYGLKASFAGRHLGYDALLSLVVAKLMGVELTKALDALSIFEPVAGRFSVERLGELVLIDDTYNANPVSTKAALDYLAELSGYKKIFVFGDMLELGDESPELHKEIGLYCHRCGVDVMFTYGNESLWALRAFRGMGGSGMHCESHREVVRRVLSEVDRRTVVLVKGSRGMRMEKIVEGIKGCFGS